MLEQEYIKWIVSNINYTLIINFIKKGRERLKASTKTLWPIVLQVLVSNRNDEHLETREFHLQQTDS